MTRAFWLLLVLCLPAGAHAQSEIPLRRLQLAAGIGIVGGASLGSADANLRSNMSSDPYRLFASSSRLERAAILDLRVAVDLTRRFGIDGHLLYGHPELRIDVSGDVESASPVTALDRLDQYVIDGGVVIALHELTAGGWQPFAAGGAGYLRQLHEGLTLTEEGTVFYVGGGARRAFVTRTRGLLRGLGARGDVRLNVLSGGVRVDDGARRHVSVSGSVFVVF